MSNTITIRKGLDIPISGAAELRLTDARNIRTYAVKPTDFVGLTPRLLVEEVDVVKVGDALFCDKSDERIRFTSPVNGKVKSIIRGEKRKLLEVVVEAEDNKTPAIYELPANPDELKALMLKCGLWPMLRQRPFGIVAHPDDRPKAIFVSGFSSAPLAPDYDFVTGWYMFVSNPDNISPSTSSLLPLTSHLTTCKVPIPLVTSARKSPTSTLLIKVK